MNNVILEVRNLKKSYQEGKIVTDVLKGVDLQIFEGEMVAIVGASGSGKSTLLHMLGTLDRPTSGEILFKNEEISRWSSNRQADFRNKCLGFIYQFHHLLTEFTALENVAIWLILFIWECIMFNFTWAFLCLISLVICGTNVFGFFRCSKIQQQKAAILAKLIFKKKENNI